ncbi:MAG TPA: hypothetical protein VFH51_02905, partial [Myxococcota bacterium]|nr:hypothetical protein [Myxococcota bacterium]
MADHSLDLLAESTRVMVNSMLGKRRNMRVPFIAAGAVVLALVSAMVLGLGRRQGNLEVAGPVYLGRAHAQDTGPAETNAAPTQAHVEVVLNNAGQVWLDGRSLGSARKHDLDLKPGKYVLVGKLGTKTMTQKLTVAGR